MKWVLVGYLLVGGDLELIMRDFITSRACEQARDTVLAAARYADDVLIGCVQDGAASE